MVTLFILLIAFQLKHFLADYPLQTTYMLGKFKPGLAFILPLTAHSAVHALFTYLISYSYFYLNKTNFMYFDISLVALIPAILDFVVHFIVDRIKASPKLLGRFKAITASEVKDYQYKLSVYELMLERKKLTKSMFKTRVEKLTSEFKTKMASNKYFWWALGADQTAHHLTHYLIIYFLVGGTL